MIASAFSQGGAKGRFQCGRIVLDHAHVDHVAAEPGQHAMQRIAVAVIDAACIQRFADRAQFITGGKECYAQTTLHWDFGDAQRCQQADVGGAQNLSFEQRRRASSARSSPLRRRLSPALTAPAGIVMPVSLSSRVNSCGITVSHSSGITPPVMMRTHSPLATLP